MRARFTQASAPVDDLGQAWRPQIRIGELDRVLALGYQHRRWEPNDMAPRLDE
jgi:hypothetical protein